MIHRFILPNIFRSLLLTLTLVLSYSAFGQSLTAGTVSGTVMDPNNAVVPNATVTIENSVTAYKQTVTTGSDGVYRFNNVPPNNYVFSASAPGFTGTHGPISVRSSVPINLPIQLTIASATETVTITDANASDMIENVSSAHVDVGRDQINRLPLRSVGNGLSDVVTLKAPGVVADSNGLFHPVGDHAEATMILDGTPISDQQSKAFSTQIPVNAIESLEVTTGAAPAWAGDKTSLVIDATTRSGLNQKRPTGSFNVLYGTFGTTHEDGAIGYGNARGGNFVAFNFERSGRFLDAPELTVLHDRGTSANIFDRIDYSPNAKDTFHLNLFFARNSFQTPNEFDQQAVGQAQRQLVNTVNIAPAFVHIFSPTTVLSINPYYRLDNVKYFASPAQFSDQPITFNQSRRLNNVGIKSDLSYVKGKHNAKFGVQISHTFLTEGFQFGITDPNFNDPASPGFLPGLLPFDLTRGGSPFGFHGHTDIKQEAFFAQDNLTLGNATVTLGVRFDNYSGITHAKLLQPRLGVSYLVKRTGTVLRGSYSRNFETPYNENLILSSVTGAGGLGNGILGDTSNLPLLPGRRHQFNVGFQQAVGKHIVIDGDYFYKRTNNAYDFNALLNTSVTFPISWQTSKLDGISTRVSLTNYKGLSAFMVAGHTRARYFPPESGGLFFNSNLPAGVFRIDHDQAFQQTTQAQYQFQQWKRLAPYVAFTWRYDSGLVSGAVPDFATALTFPADQQAQIGLFCGSTFATPSQAITSCASANRGALRVRIPADGTANDDHNPPRITPRHLFDFSAGTDNLLRTEHTRMTLRFTVLNLTNKEALYNFQSTFSGTHFVAPRSFQGQVGVTF
ncbi:MAG TPA: carboxypeptidase regulatory-like domain-containing protein [Pyrinomonadaceae bacterium]|nr:carboxypeptidase regulatory-like domain-containing protein [Pyrinomonadaceae bacterium]